MRISLLCLPAILTAAAPAFAGYVAYSGPATVTMTDAQPGVGDTMTVTAGAFASYDPDGPSDPQITTDLDLYGWTLDAACDQLLGSQSLYSGTYTVFYDVNDNGTFEDAIDYHVSKGTTSMTVSPVVELSGVSLMITFGSLQQTAGPEMSPPFADISYGQPIGFGGTITVPTTSPAIGTMALTFSAVPEPGMLGALGIAGCLLFRRRG